MFIYNLLAIFVFVFSLVLFSRAAGSIAINKINTISFIMYRDIIPVAFIGSLLIVNNLVDIHPVIQLISDETKIKGFLFVLYSLIAIPLGMLTVNVVRKVNVRKKLDEYSKSNIVEVFSYKTIKTISFVLTIISFITLVYILYFSPSIPILTALKGNTLEASIQRRENKVNFGGIIYIKNILGFYFMPLVAYYIYILKFNYKTIFFNVLFYINLLFVAILLLYDTQKAQILYFIIGFIVIESLIKKSIKLGKLIFILSFMVVGVFSLYIIITGAKLEHLLRFDSVIFYRFFIGQISGYFLSLEWFSNIINESTIHIGIPSFILNIFGISNIESARLLMMYFSPEGIATGNSGLMSSFFLGEAWANYGYTGLLLSPFIVGAVIQMVHIWLLTSEKDPFNIALYSVITTKWVVTGGFVGFLYLKVLIIPVILYLFYKLLINFIVKLK